MYTDRLLEFAIYLDDGEVGVEWTGATKVLNYDANVKVRVLTALMMGLPIVFTENFDYDESSFPVPDKNPLELLPFVQEFFGLEASELFHVFCLRKQAIDKYGGMLLSEISFPQHVAENILELMRRQGLWSPPNLN